MIAIHMENMIGWRLHHLVTFGQKDRLKDIDHLGKASHLNTITMFIKNIQCDSCNQSIPNCVLLIEETRVRTRFDSVPASPLIHYHANPLLRIVLIHDLAMSFDEFLHIKSLVQGLIPDLLIKFRCRSLDLPAFRMNIVME